MLKETAEAFPGAEIVGNKTGPPLPGTFAVYIEGVGPGKKRDAEGRFYVYKKNKADELPFPRQILDNLFVLVYSYGDACELAKYQENHHETIGLTTRTQDAILVPVLIEEESKQKINKQTGEVEYESDQAMYCTNWACTNP